MHSENQNFYLKFSRKTKFIDQTNVYVRCESEGKDHCADVVTIDFDISWCWNNWNSLMWFPDNLTIQSRHLANVFYWISPQM